MRKLFTIICLFVGGMVRGQCDFRWIDFDYDTCYRQTLFIDTVNYHHNLWQVGKPHKVNFDSAYIYSQPNVIVTDTLNPYSANDTSVFFLKIPLLSDGWPLSQVDFMYRTDIDSGEMIKVELSSDTLLQWKDAITDTLPYGLSRNLYDTVFRRFTPDWEWFPLHRSWPPHPYSNDTVIMKFTFISDSVGPGKDGWMIDYIHLSYYWESVPLFQNPTLITLFPNPSHGNIYLHTDKPNKDATITIHNLQGQQVYSGIAPFNGYLNMQLPNGVYTLRYSDDEEYCVKQVVIQN